MLLARYMVEDENQEEVFLDLKASQSLNLIKSVYYNMVGKVILYDQDK